MDIKTKLQEKIKTGSMAEIASQETLKAFVEEQTTQQYAMLLAYYREGKHGMELLAVLGELSALDKLQNNMRIKVANKYRALEQLEEMENVTAHQNTDY